MASVSPPGIDPVMDLLGKMESQISRMETARPEPIEVRSPLESPEIKALREELAHAEQRGSVQLALFTEALVRLRTQIPELVEDAIATRFVDIEERFYSQIRQIHQQAADSFMQSTHARVGTRVAAVEATMAEQSLAMADLKQSSLETDRNLQRMLAGLDRLTGELMRLSTLAGAPIVTRRASQLSGSTAQASATQAPPERPTYSEAAAEPRNEKVSSRSASPSRFLIPALFLLILIPAAILGWRLVSSKRGVSLRESPESAVVSTALTGTAAQLKLASDFAAGKDYSKAESIYRSVLRTEPENRTAIKELASVLFRQQKYDEAATVLKTLPPGS